MAKRFVVLDAEFPQRLQRLRRKAGLTQEQLADKSGLSRELIVRYESGRRARAKDSSLLALCKTLGIGFDDLIPSLKPPPSPAAAHDARNDVKRIEFRARRIRWTGIVVLALSATLWLVLHGFGSQPVPTDENNAVIAYTFFTSGIQCLKTLDRVGARRDLRKAISTDSTYAEAYVWLLHPEIVVSLSEADTLIQLAHRYSDQLQEKDRLLLDAFEAWWHGDIIAATNHLEKLTSLYPGFIEAHRLLARSYYALCQFDKAETHLKVAIYADSSDGMSFNRLAYLYADLRQYDKALKMTDMYEDVALMQPNPHDTRGDILGQAGRLDEAIASYGLALERDPEFFPAIQHLGAMYVLKGEYSTAKDYLRELETIKEIGARSRSRLFMAWVPLYQGKLTEALLVLDRGLDDDVEDGFQGSAYLAKLDTKAMILAERGDVDGALDIYRHLLAIDQKTSNGALEDWPMQYVRLLCIEDVGAAGAYLDTLRVRVDASPTYNDHLYWSSKGWIELSRHDVEGAIRSFSRATECRFTFALRFPLALAYMQAGRYSDAAQEMEHLVSRYTENRVRYALWSVKAHYYLGVAYEKLGKPAAARQELERFASTWSQADWPFPELVDARKRLSGISPSG